MADDAVTTTSDASEPVPTRWTKSTVYRDMWVDPDDDPRETDVEAVDERGTLLDYLGRYRLTLQMKCADLNVEQLARRSVPPSTMSLLGLVRHLAEEERHLRRVMAGEDAPKLYRTDEDRDGDWNGAIADPAVVEDAWRPWRAEVELTDQLVAESPKVSNNPDAKRHPGAAISSRGCLSQAENCRNRSCPRRVPARPVAAIAVLHANA